MLTIMRFNPSLSVKGWLKSIAFRARVETVVLAQNFLMRMLLIGYFLSVIQEENVRRLRTP